jgi:hypothetical protein
MAQRCLTTGALILNEEFESFVYANETTGSTTHFVEDGIFNEKCVSLIPWVTRGALFGILINKLSTEIPTERLVELSIVSPVPKLIRFSSGNAVLYKIDYDSLTAYSLCDILRQIYRLGMVKDGEILTVPFIGTNRSFSFYKSAINVYYACKMICDEIPNLKIQCVTKRTEGSYRSLLHCKRLHQNEKTTKDRCLICCENNASQLFCDCGHYVSCSACVNMMKLQNDGCPFCRVKITKSVEIFDVVKSEKKCCESDLPKKQMICFSKNFQCNHLYDTCSQCSSSKNCHICGIECERYAFFLA